MKNGHLLRVHNLHVEREDCQILRSLNLVVDRGSVHVVLGLNGSGKSTLAYTLVGSGGYVASDGEMGSMGSCSTR